MESSGTHYIGMSQEHIATKFSDVHYATHADKVAGIITELVAVLLFSIILSYDQNKTVESLQNHMFSQFFLQGKLSKDSQFFLQGISKNVKKKFGNKN